MNIALYLYATALRRELLNAALHDIPPYVIHKTIECSNISFTSFDSSFLMDLAELSEPLSS